MRTIMALLLIGLAFAGCFGDDEPADDHGDHMDGEDHMDDAMDNGTMDDNATAPVANTPPVATLTANVTNATIPFDVLFDFSVEDVDGDSILWTFDADGDGTPETEGEWFADNGTYPASNFTFSYTANGTYNATLSVDDLSNATVAVVQITANEVVDEVVEGELEDRGAYGFDPATGHCHVHEFSEPAPGIYTSNYEGGTWVFAETNSVPGLQISDNHPAGGNFTPPNTEDCLDGDLILV